ncbi:MAG: hypothetical protein HFI38_02490 [Lachnospiraceae bacterium]|jgi:hypothetical protein|nr:hypothetical protein [Lachnospiraceae bacterium]
MNEMSKAYKLPMKVIQIYLFTTIILYVFGPWQWKDLNMALTVGLLLSYQTALYLGYRYSSIGYMKRKTRTVYFSKHALQMIILLGFAVTLLQCIRTIGSVNISSILKQVLQGLTDAASQYRASKEVTNKFGGAAATYFIVLTAPITWMAIPLSIRHFKELNMLFRVIAIANIFLEVSRWLAIGTNKGIIDILIIAVCMIYLNSIAKCIKKRSNLNKSKTHILIIGVVLTVIGLYIFENNVGSRINSNWRNYEITNGNTPINYDSLLMQLLPPGLSTILILVASYLTQGYYAFSLCRSVEWIPMFGTGNSMFIIENIRDLFGFSLYDYTYQTRIACFNWDPFVNWHSFYVWLANDFSIIGVIFVMFILGYLFCQVVQDAIIKGDDLAIVLFCLFAIMFIYLPANNQILSYPTTFMAFWVILIIWKITRKYKLRIGSKV